MKFEILNNNAVVVTKIDNVLHVGTYHDVYNKGEVERIFEPLCPLEKCTIEVVLLMCNGAE